MSHHDSLILFVLLPSIVFAFGVAAFDAHGKKRLAIATAGVFLLLSVTTYVVYVCSTRVIYT